MTRFLRELPIPLVPTDMFDKFKSYVTEQGEGKQLSLYLSLSLSLFISFHPFIAFSILRSFSRSSHLFRFLTLFSFSGF